MNRAVGRRPLFAGEADMRRFECVLADVVAEGLMRVHAYALMTTHYHLLADSPEGTLDVAMHGLQGNYARWFNTTCDRDGPLFRSRYRAKRIDDTYYRDAVLWYIDRNPVEAGIVMAPSDYPFGSAYHYRRPPGPSWLTRTLVESIAAPRHGGTFDPARYGTEAVGSSAGALWRVVDELVSGPGSRGPALSGVLDPRPEHVERWLNANALKADGITRHAPIVTPEAILTHVPVVAANFTPPDHARRIELSLLAGLLYEFGGERHAAIAARVGLTLSGVRHRIALHRTLWADDAGYRAAATDALRRAALTTFEPVSAAPRR